jgi:PAS domain S-box-containing protein
MQSETKYRMLVELAQEGVWALDAENCIVFANPRMAEMLGYAINEMVGNNFSAFIDETDIDVALHNLEGCKLGKQGQCEFEFIRKDGTRIYASVAASSIKNDEGNSIGTIALVADITERKKAEEELKRSLDKLELMNEKMHVVGSLTRHDVRNKLLAVPGYAYLLKQKHADQADIVNGLGKMEQAVKEIEKIFEFAKIYEELGAEELTYLDVEKAVNEATELFSGLTIEVVNDCHGLTVLADSFLRQLFYNFIDNTRKYGKTTTTIRVYSEKEGIGDLKLVYEDNGVGISAENKLQLFRKGFSTGGSTGFGLFLIKKMIDAYGWKIQENGEPGKGAKFIMTIPKLNKNGKDSFQIAAKHDSKQTLERDIQSFHISNSEENYTLSSNNDVAPVLSEKGGNDIANQRINR